MKAIIKFVIGAMFITSPVALASHGKNGKKKAELALYCEGVESGIQLAVFENSNGDYHAKVWNKGHLIRHDYVEKDFLIDGEDYSEQVRLVYSSGSVLDGGFNIRVIIVKPEAPEVAGEGHITIKINGKIRNSRLQCALPY